MDRIEQQTAGTHPAPCARHCEANAFQIEIRRAWASYESAVEAGKKLAQQALKAEQERDCAVHALTRAGHTLAEGAAEWKPPIGPAATPLLDKINKISSERDAIAAELKALREQAPVAWGDEPWMASFGVRVGRDSSNSIDLIFTTVGQRKFQLYAHEAAYLRGLLNKAEIPGYPNTHPAPARELTDADIALCIASADKSFAQERISGKPVLGVWSKHLARAIERYLKGESE